MMEIYRVVPGDNLWKISQFFGVTIQSIINVNGITSPGNLVIGMELLIPKESLNYFVKRGDTLWQIANKFRVNIRDIIDRNNLVYPYYISIGQRLIIPYRGLTHTVRPGDALWYISARYGVSIQDLITLNDLTPPYTLNIGQVLRIPFGIGGRMDTETLGYFNPTGIQNPNVILDTLGPYLTYLGLVDFPITETGEILGSVPDGFLDYAKEKNVMVLPVLTNILRGEFNSDLARSVISNEENLNRLLDNIINLLEQYNFQGIIVDFENLYPDDRELFTNFIRLLYGRLKEEGKLLILNMAPKWEDWFEREWAGFFDYEALEPFIDRAAIMTFEWGWREGPPRPTAPIENIEKALNYAFSRNIPPEKILMGLTLYGYDWILPDTPENLATTVTLPQVWSRGINYNSSIRFDNMVRQPIMDYIANNIQHRVWFENALSHYFKYKLINEYNLKGVFYWIINQSFPSTWYMVSNFFNIIKQI